MSKTPLSAANTACQSASLTTILQAVTALFVRRPAVPQQPIAIKPFPTFEPVINRNLLGVWSKGKAWRAVAAFEAGAHDVAAKTVDRRRGVRSKVVAEAGVSRVELVESWDRPVEVKPQPVTDQAHSNLPQSPQSSAGRSEQRTAARGGRQIRQRSPSRSKCRVTAS